MDPVFSYPNHPATPPWSHPHATFNTRSKNTSPALTVLKKLPDMMIFLSSVLIHIPKVFLHVFAIYNKNTLLITDYCTASTPMHSLLLATTSLLKRVGDCPEQQGIAMFYSNTGLPTLTSDNRIICNVTLINTFYNSVDDTLTNNPLSFLTGHWFSKHWVDTWTEEWFKLAVKTAFQVTLTSPQTIPKPLSERLLED